MADLRREQKPQTIEPPVRRKIDVPGMRGEIPFSPATVILTEAEKAALKKSFGWKEGDPVPHLSKVVQAEVGGAKFTLGEAAEVLKTVPANTYPEGTANFVPPKVVDIKNLDEAKQAEITEAISAMRHKAQEAKTNPAKEQPFIPRDPSIGRAHDVAQKQAAEQALKAPRKSQPTVEVEDDRPGRAGPEEGPKAAAGPKTVGPDQPFTFGVTHCQHCGWELAKADEVVVELADRRVYQAAILGGKRFVKTYDIMDGALKVTFRALTSKETDRIKKQLYLDGKAEKVVTPAEVWRLAQEYQLAVCLQTLRSEEGVAELPTVDKHRTDQTEDTTGLPEILDYVYETAVPSETLRRVLLDLYVRFDALQAKLEVESLKPDFLRATGSAC